MNLIHVLVFVSTSINLSVSPGQLIAVVGHVSAGKSSLLSSLLGETINRNGTVQMNVSAKLLILTSFVLK